MKKIVTLLLLILCIGLVGAGIRRTGLLGLWCYSCVSTQPGCGDEVDWRIHHAITCPRDNDKCVKITETKGAERIIIRDCLSNLEGLRRDIPADSYEGCRPAAEMPKLAVYVQNNIKELDIRRDYWDKTEYCFCEFDQWCNSASGRVSNLMLVFGLATYLTFKCFAS